MSGPINRQPPAAQSGQDAFVGAANLSQKLTTNLLQQMIENAANYRSWGLSDREGGRMMTLIMQKQQVICASFAFQLKQNFFEFRTAHADADKQAARWQHLGLSGSGLRAEIAELQEIVNRYGESFREFDRSILKRLQACIRRSRAAIYENPLQVKRLCESFQYAIDGLSLDTHYKIALYHLFADRFVDKLGPVYERIDRYLLDSGMQPDLPLARIHLRSIEGSSAERSDSNSAAPKRPASLAELLKSFLDKSRGQSARLTNLFPELKSRCNEAGIDSYDDHIDQLNLIFKLIFDDEDLPSSVTQQLGRLQIFIFITAIEEKNFLKRSSNPARRLLEGIINSEVEIAHSGRPEFSGIRYLREQLDKLTGHDSIPVERYSELLEGYRNFVSQHETETRRRRRMEEARKLLPLVKKKIDEITRPLKAQGTPLIVFNKVWCPLMVQIALHRGMDSDPWQKSLDTIRKQVWTMIPKSTEEEKQQLLTALPQVDHSLHRAMRSLKLAEGLQRSLRDYLKLEQQNVIEQTTRNIAEAQRKTQSAEDESYINFEDTTEFDAMMQTGIFQVPTEMIEAMDAAKQKNTKKTNQVESLKTSDWVRLYHDGSQVLAKVAWKAEDSSLFIFIDRDGARVCELTGVEIGQCFESGDIAVVDASAMDAEKNQYSFMKNL
jgi:hypothetical protein